VHDAVIVGSGAGGGAVAWRLATAGWRVLVLEKGPRYARDQYRHSAGGLQPGAFVPGLDVDPHTVVTQRTTTPRRSHTPAAVPPALSVEHSLRKVKHRALSRRFPRWFSRSRIATLRVSLLVATF